MDVKIDASWKKVLQDEFEKPYFAQLTNFVRDEYKTKKIFPPGNMIFSAFDHCPFDKVKVVIIGQDPYHNDNQANGLCFSVSENVATPPSLKNIFTELRNDLGVERTKKELDDWAEQGVLLLNATLTVKAHSPNSHKNLGWEQFTDFIIKEISDRKENVVFVLWGAFAQKKEELIDSSKHFIIKSAHPSPFSVYRGFYGSKPFSQINGFLHAKEIESISW